MLDALCISRDCLPSRLQNYPFSPPRIHPQCLALALVALLVAPSHQQRPVNLSLLRNLRPDQGDYVQRYEYTAPIRPAPRPAPVRPAAPARPAPRPAARPAPLPAKVERRLFNVLLRTAGGFDETCEYPSAVL